MYNNNINHTMTVEDLATAITRVTGLRVPGKEGSPEAVAPCPELFRLWGHGG